MPATIGDVIDAARGVLQDKVNPNRFSNNELYSLFSEAVAEMRRLRPDLFLTTLFTDVPRYTSADKDAVLPFWDGYQVAVTNFVVGRAELRDDQFTTDSRAGQLLAAFKAQLSTPMA